MRGVRRCWAALAPRRLSTFAQPLRGRGLCTRKPKSSGQITGLAVRRWLCLRWRTASL
jgi:hypothetical protein